MLAYSSHLEMTTIDRLPKNYSGSQPASLGAAYVHTVQFALQKPGVNIHWCKKSCKVSPSKDHTSSLKMSEQHLP